MWRSDQDLCIIIVFSLPVSGLGFGIISGAFSLINVLADSTGPGTIGIHGDSSQFFITSGGILVDIYFNDLYFSFFLSPPVHMHGGLICIAFCPSIRPDLRKKLNYTYMAAP